MDKILATSGASIAPLDWTLHPAGPCRGLRPYTPGRYRLALRALANRCGPPLANPGCAADHYGVTSFQLVATCGPQMIWSHQGHRRRTVGHWGRGACPRKFSKKTFGGREQMSSKFRQSGIFIISHTYIFGQNCLAPPHFYRHNLCMIAFCQFSI